MGGIKARIKRETFKRRVPHPSYRLTCALSTKSNINYMHEYKTASFLAFTETWLKENDNNDMLHIDGLVKTEDSRKHPISKRVL